MGANAKASTVSATRGSFIGHPWFQEQYVLDIFFDF
jgi:hypothetical protein